MSELPSPDFHVELVQGGMKAAMASTGAKSRDLLMVPVDQIKIIAGLNIRIHDDDYEAHTEEIKESIIENGFYLHFPLSGYAGKEGEETFIYLTGGFTRFEAAKRAIKAGAPIEALPMVLKPNGTSMQDLTVALAQDNTGSPLKPYERAIIIKRLVGYGMDEETIAQKMQISGQYVKDMLFALGLPNTVQQMIVNGQVSMGHAVATARKHGANAIKVLQEAEGTDATSAAAKRITPKQTRTAAAGNTIVPKKTLIAAIDYAISLPDGIEFLTRWRKAEADALDELTTFMKQPKARKNAKKAKASGKKPGRPKKVKPVDDDPDFDIDVDL
jgi:ParB-like chromosome segregation protein Spo0J